MGGRAIIYARVSTDEQKVNTSLDDQMLKCRRYAETHGFTVVAEFRDDYTGAVPIEHRPEGKKAYALLANGEAHALIANRIDRLVRPPEEGDEFEIPILIRRLAKLGKEIHTCEDGKLENSFIGLMTAVFRGKTAGDERRKIIERMNDGKRHKASIQGLVVGVGKPPYGYRYVYAHEQGETHPKLKNRIVGLSIVDAEAKITRRIFHWYCFGDNGEPMTDFAIARRLSEMHLPTPGELRHKARTRSSGIWNSTTVRFILTNQTYAGVMRYGKRIGKEAKKRRPIEEQIAVVVPAIVEGELWGAAQTQRQYNRKMSKRNAKNQYLLRGMCRCEACGTALAGMCHHNQEQWRYYRCNHKNNHYAGLEKRCEQKSVRADVLESIVWNYILDLWSDKRRFECALRTAQQTELDAMQPKRERLASILELIADCQNEATDLAQAMKRARGLVSQKLDADMADVNQRHERLIKEREELQKELSAQTLSNERIDAALQQRADVMLGIQNATCEDKRRTLELLKVQVTVKDGWGQISSRVPVVWSGSLEPSSFNFNTSRTL